MVTKNIMIISKIVLVNREKFAMEIFYKKNIGFLHDVCQVIICKTAKRDSWINTFVLSGHEDEDIEELEHALKYFTSVDMCWKIFTYRHPQKGILLSRMFVEFLNSIQQEWKMNDFEKYISDYELLKELVCEWYFEK